MSLFACHFRVAAADARFAVKLRLSAIPQGPFSIHAGAAYTELGKSLQAQGKADEARAAFRSAVEHLEATLGSDHAKSLAARQLAGLNPQ